MIFEEAINTSVGAWIDIRYLFQPFNKLVHVPNQDDIKIDHMISPANMNVPALDVLFTDYFAGSMCLNIDGLII